MNSGYTKPLYLLPFDHRASFESGMFGWSGTLSATKFARIAAAILVIYDGFVSELAVVEVGQRYCQSVDTFERAQSATKRVDIPSAAATFGRPQLPNGMGGGAA